MDTNTELSSYEKLLRAAMNNDTNSVDRNHDDNDGNTEGDEGGNRPTVPGSRLAFGTSQEDADLALARILQEQENAYMMLARMERAGGAAALVDGAHDIDDDQEEGEDGETHFDDDEAFARALQAEEVRAQTERLLSLSRVGSGSSGAVSSDYGSYERHSEDYREAPGLDHHDDADNVEGERYNDMGDDDEEEEDGGLEDYISDEGDPFDPDNMTYEELMALGDAVGAAPRGASASVIDALPQSVFASSDVNNSTRRRSLSHTSSSACLPQCVICQSRYTDGERLCTLPCEHDYHADCIHQWLAINKVCPMCNREVSAPAA